MSDTPATSELDQLRQQAAEYLDGWKRAKADYLNLKKDADKEKENIAQFAQAAAIMRLLPMYDNLKRAVQHIPADQAEQEWAKGFTHIRKQFEDTLKQMGLEPIPTVGHPFDPNLHHAVQKVQQDGATSGQIIEEVKSGFMVGDRVLEPAQVTVAE